MSFKEKFGVRPLVVITTVLGVFMAVLDSEVVNVAIPKMMSVFATTQSTISWVVTIYLLTQGMLTPASLPAPMNHRTNQRVYPERLKVRADSCGKVV